MAKPKLTSEPHFLTWAFSKVERLRKAVGVGAILIAAVSINALEPDKWLETTDWVSFMKDHAPGRARLAFIQAVACFLLALFTPKPSTAALKRRAHMGEQEMAIAREICRRIQLLVVASYLARSLYYFIAGLSLWREAHKHLPDIFDRVMAVNLNMIPSLLLFWLYIELSELMVEVPSLKGKKNGEPVSTEGEPIDSSNAAFYRVLSLGVTALIIAPTWYAYAKQADNIVYISEIAAACLNGVSLALVVGRLGSKIIDPGSITLGLLYFYAVIQPAAAMFHDTPVMRLAATTVALPLKILLWLVLVWAFTTGILSEYVHDIRVLLTSERSNAPEDE